MNKTRIAVAIGGAAGASLAAAVIWLWQTVTGDRAIAPGLGTAVFGAVVFVIGGVTGRMTVKAARNANAQDMKRYAAYYRLAASWMLLRNSGRSLTEYFEGHHYRSIAVYGLGPLGMCLLGEMRRRTLRFGMELIGTQTIFRIWISRSLRPTVPSRRWTRL